jgi:hypothetical protein
VYAVSVQGSIALADVALVLLVLPRLCTADKVSFSASAPLLGMSSFEFTCIKYFLYCLVCVLHVKLLVLPSLCTASKAACTACAGYEQL